MKTRFKILPPLLCFAILLASSVVFTRQASATDKDSEHLTISEPVMVAGTVLEAGMYKVTWEGSGAQVQVSFTKGSKTMATATATLVLETSAYDGAIEVKTL